MRNISGRLENLPMLNRICLQVKILLQINNSYFSKMVLENSGNKSSVLGLQYEPYNLDVNKVCFVK